MSPIRANERICLAWFLYGFSQAFSVNSLRWRIRGEWAANVSLLRSDHVTRNAMSARNNESGLGKNTPISLPLIPPHTPVIILPLLLFFPSPLPGNPQVRDNDLCHLFHSHFHPCFLPPSPPPIICRKDHFSRFILKRVQGKRYTWFENAIRNSSPNLLLVNLDVIINKL